MKIASNYLKSELVLPKVAKIISHAFFPREIITKLISKFKKKTRKVIYISQRLTP